MNLILGNGLFINDYNFFRGGGSGQNFCLPFFYFFDIQKE